MEPLPTNTESLVVVYWTFANQGSSLRNRDTDAEGMNFLKLGTLCVYWPAEDGQNGLLCVLGPISATLY